MSPILLKTFVLDDKQLLKQVLDELKLLKKENELLRQEVKQFKLRVEELESKLEKYENPKNSGNSGIPPSQDPFRKTKSLRGKSKRKPGGQKERKGKKLEMSNAPDKVILYDITNCDCCGHALPKEPQRFDARQVFDLPPIKISVTEHRRSKKTCQYCGLENKASFPEGLVQPAQYGDNLKALCAYLQNYQMLPYARCSEFIEDLTGHPIATGSLSNFQRQCFALLVPYQEAVKRQLLKSPVLHADETGIRLNGKNQWMHVLSNSTISFFSHHPKRGKEAMDDIGLLEKYKGILVHDRFASYFSYQCEHSLCNAHILRDLSYVEEAFEAPWAKEIGKLLVRAKTKKGRDASLKKSYYTKVFNKYTSLVRPVIKNYDKKFKKTDEQRLAFGLEKHKYLFLKFIKQPEVPFDNNQAERDLRMIKVKQKISGCFRSESHANYFASIRGYISTLKKNHENVLENIKNVFLEKPFMSIMGE